jgi:hypothetical protein
MYGHDGCALKDLTIRSLTFFDTISCDVQNVIDEKITRAEDITPLIDINFDEPLACETCFPDGTLSFYRNVQHLFRLATNLRKSAVELVEHRSSWMLERGSLLAEAELLNFDDVPIHDCNFSKYAQYLIEKIRAFVAKGERPWVPSIDDPIFVTLPYRY